jgi:hypothetical protein
MLYSIAAGMQFPSVVQAKRVHHPNSGHSLQAAIAIGRLETPGRID